MSDLLCPWCGGELPGEPGQFVKCRHCASDFYWGDNKPWRTKMQAANASQVHPTELSPPVEDAAPTPSESDFVPAESLPPDMTNSVGIRMKMISAGSFTMGDAEGDTDEAPHKVTLTQPFYLGLTPVTIKQWYAVVGSVPSEWTHADDPVVSVSWKDAKWFCRKLSAMPDERAAGREYRLPTEAEWEYACRAGSTTAYSFGEDKSLLRDFGWYDIDYDYVKPVGRKQPNAWGLYDMHGNVWEWCSDRYGEYESGSVADPRGPSEGSFRVYRGGSCCSTARDLRSANRNGCLPSIRYGHLGFRLALSPSGAKPPKAGK